LDEGFILPGSFQNQARHLGLLPVVEREGVDRVAGVVKEQQFEII
jgi:hypothetical protein